MPNSLFSAEQEKKLLEVWGEMLLQTDKAMMTRAEKESQATAKLNDYSKEIGLTSQFTKEQVGNKIDSLKKKGKALYDRFRKATAYASGSAVIDIEGAKQAWKNFDVYHKVFKRHPTWGPGLDHVRDTADVVEGSQPGGSPIVDVSDSEDGPSCSDLLRTPARKRKRPQQTFEEDEESIMVGEEGSHERETSFDKDHDEDKSESPEHGEKKKKNRTQRAAVSVDRFVQGLGILQQKLQEQQQNFDTEQAQKHREWIESRDKERVLFEQKLQQSTEKHHQSMVKSMQEHQQTLQQNNMEFMAQLFKRMDRN